MLNDLRRFQLMSRRNERAAAELTPNRTFDAWAGGFGDDVMAAALLDHLLHRCHIVNLPGNLSAATPRRARVVPGHLGTSWRRLAAQA